MDVPGVLTVQGDGLSLSLDGQMATSGHLENKSVELPQCMAIIIMTAS